MKKKIIWCILIAFMLSLATPSYKDHYVRPRCPLKATEASISDFIEYHACMFDLEAKPLIKVAYCESKLKPNAINYNDGGKGKHSVGVFQFQRKTFDYWETKLGEDLDYYSSYDQIKLASFMFKEGQAKQWTCARKLGIV